MHSRVSKITLAYTRVCGERQLGCSDLAVRPCDLVRTIGQGIGGGLHWRLIGVVCLLVLGCVLPLRAQFATFDTNQLVFVNVDHAAVGTYSTLAYGAKTDQCGLGQSSASIPYSAGGGGVVIALSGPGGIQAMPFVAGAASIADTATFFADTNVQRALTPCADQWSVHSAGLTFTHFSPAWAMSNAAAATMAERRRFFLPATWLQFTIVNTNTTPEDFYFGLCADGAQTSYAGGAYRGFAVGEAALAAQSGTCDLLSGDALASALDGMDTGFAFHVNIPAGQTGSLTVVVAHYRNSVLDSRISGCYYYTSLFASMDSVVDAAFAAFADAQMRCQQLASSLAGAQLNVFRQFLASRAFHSYQACTCAVLDSAGNFGWREYEGAYNFVNTFDLTVDHAYYDCVMQPWALRNVLDTYSGATNGPGYTFNHPLYNYLSGGVASSNGFGFHHDMGTGPTSDAPGTDPTSYESGFSYMGQEELQNWILCAGLYWHFSGDNLWLSNNAALLQTCLTSMLLRDDTNAATRDGVTTFLNKRGSNFEITTYDSLDPSLNYPRNNAMTCVKNWAAYLALQAMFNQIAEIKNVAICSTMAALAAQSIVNAWNTYGPTLGYIPAFLDGSNQSALLPVAEGLAYPCLMGLTNATDRSGGPFAPMLHALSNHVVAVLKSGLCLDATSGSWKLSSANVNTWQSKIYLGQFVMQNVLGINNSNVNGYIDQVHATLQASEAPYQGWSDQLNSTGWGRAFGSEHYPRGITSTLWWLNPGNNPPYPVPSAPPAPPTGLAGFANYDQNLLLWNGSALATGYHLWRSTVSGGPYVQVVRTLSGASYTDTGLTNGVTYYYVVTATNSAGESLPSAEVAVTPMLPAPSGVTATAGDGFVALSWSPALGASGYLLLRSTHSGGPYAALATNLGTAFTDTNVVNGITYYYALQSLFGAGGSSTDSAEVAATPSPAIPFYAINSGGPAVGSFAADACYVNGNAYSTASAIDTNGLFHPAPAAVYQTERYADSSGNVTYIFANLTPDAGYLVRLHFAEIYFTNAGQRIFNVFINGAQIITNLDIFAATGASDTALIREFNLAAGPAGEFVIVASNVVQNAKINGIEILSPDAYRAAAAFNLAISAATGNLTISWPQSYAGWILQTNGGNLQNSAGWGDVPNSQTNTQMTFPAVNSAIPAEFFRLRPP